jgi:hypothetical protein
MPRKLIWIGKAGGAGWGCSQCAWVFQVPSVPAGKSLDEILQTLELQMNDAFAHHVCAVCAEYPKSVS